MTDHCAHIIYPETSWPYPQPPEYCDAACVPGSAYCEDHQEDEE